jgi:HSP20 family protein
MATNTTNLAERSDNDVEPVQERRDVIAPPVDVYENSEELLLVADVPGATKDGIRVQLEAGLLTIHAKRRTDAAEGTIASEHQPMDYSRSFSVPHGIDASKIRAELSAGVLQLHLPKLESLKPRRIEVKQG